MASNMSMTWDAGKQCWRFLNNNKPAREIFLTHEEVSFITGALRRNAWGSDLMCQIGYDEDNLDLTGDLTEEAFFALCMEEIDNNVECYGDDYQPDFEDIVFNVAQDNGIWID